MIKTFKAFVKDSTIQESLNRITLKTEILEKYGEFLEKLYLYESRSSIELSVIKVKKSYQNQGIGAKIMNHICDYADTHFLIVSLTPTDEFGFEKSKLIEFYKRFGFVMNSGKNLNSDYDDEMIRYPKKVKECIQESLIGTIKRNISIKVEVETTQHAEERQSRHSSENDFIISEEIFKTASKFIEIITKKILLNDIDLKQRIFTV